MQRIAMGLTLLSLSAWAIAQEAPEATTEAPSTEAEAPEAEPEPPAGPTAYTLDPSASFLAVTVYKDPNTLGSGLAHDHAVVASTFDGKVVWSSTDASACSVSISFPVTALTVDPGNARSRVGIDPDDSVGDSGKNQIKSNFMGKSQLYADSFPTISFTSTSCSGTSGTVDVTGELSIRGVAKTVTAKMAITEDGSSFPAKGSFDLTHDDFGFKPFTAGFGALKNQNKLHFVVDVQGSPG